MPTENIECSAILSLLQLGQLVNETNENLKKQMNWNFGKIDGEKM